MEGCLPDTSSLNTPAKAGLDLYRAVIRLAETPVPDERVFVAARVSLPLVQKRMTEPFLA